MRADIRPGPRGRLRAEIWVNALLDDLPDDDDRPDAMPENVTSLIARRQGLIRHLVSLIERRHQTWKRYPVVATLAKVSGGDRETLGLAYLQHLRRDLESASAPRTGLNSSGGSVVALRAVEGHSGGP